MKRVNGKYKVKGHVLTVTVLFGLISLFLTCFFAKIVRVKYVEIDQILEELKVQSEAQANNPRANLEVHVQEELGFDIRPDFRCLFWKTTEVGRGWTNDFEDQDFFVDYYIPPDKEAMVCTTPALAAAFIAKHDRPFLYKVYPTEYGFRVRIVQGLSKVREPCKNWTGNVDCANAILSRQGIIKYEP